MDIVSNSPGYPTSPGTWDAFPPSAPATHAAPSANAPYALTPQHFPPTSARTTPSIPFAYPHGAAQPATAPFAGTGYGTTKRQGMPPKTSGTPQAPKEEPEDSSWDLISYRNERLNDIINGSGSAYTNFTAGRSAWQQGRYIDSLLDTTQGISGALRALRGSFGMGRVFASGMGQKRDAKFFKDTANYFHAARRALDAVAGPLSSFRTVAQTLSNPASTRAQKLLSIADYLDQFGQTTGLAILKLDRRSGDTLLQLFGYTMFAVAAQNAGIRQAIFGYQQAIRMLGSNPTAAAKAALVATQSLITGTQAVAEYLADELKALGFRRQAGGMQSQIDALKGASDTMYTISAHLLTAMNFIDSGVILMNQFSKT